MEWWEGEHDRPERRAAAAAHLNVDASLSDHPPQQQQSPLDHADDVSPRDSRRQQQEDRKRERDTHESGKEKARAEEEEWQK